MRRGDFPCSQRSAYWFVWYGNSKGKVSRAQNKGLAHCSQLVLKRIQMYLDKISQAVLRIWLEWDFKRIWRLPFKNEVLET